LRTFSFLPRIPKKEIGPPKAPLPPDVAKPPLKPRPTPVPPMPAIFPALKSVEEEIAGMSGSETFASPVEVIRFACAGALMVFCFLAIVTLCSNARWLLFGEGGAEVNVSLRLATMD
jgi:hypothetical protein